MLTNPDQFVGNVIELPDVVIVRVNRTGLRYNPYTLTLIFGGKLGFCLLVQRSRWTSAVPLFADLQLTVRAKGFGNRNYLIGTMPRRIFC